MPKSEKGHNSVKYLQKFAKSQSGHLHSRQSLCAKYHDHSSNASPDILLIRFHRLTMHMSDQMTSGPVNAHLTPGPGIYFNAFIHVYSPREGTDNPLGTNLDINRKPFHLAHLLQVSEKLL